MMEPWHLQPTQSFERDHKHYQKKHKDELKCVLNNLDTYFRTLCECGSPSLVQVGFVYPEPMGIKAIDQRCGGIRKKLQETRLYIYSDVKEKRVVLLGIGDKRSQSRDIEEYKKKVKGMKQGGQ